MALSKDRIVVVGETPHAHEAAAVKWVNEQLPDVDPYHTWALFDLYDPSTGRSHEIDILVLGYSALYLVEVKSHPGHIEGDRVDWTWTRPDGSKGYLEPPYSLTNLKAKVLKTRLQKELGRDTPWVEALVFLSSDELTTKFTNYGDNHVVTRKNFLNAVQRNEFPGADKNANRRRIDRPVAQKLAKALSALGVRARKGKHMAAGFELGDVIAEGSGYQDREAKRVNMEGVRARARTYLVPEQTALQRKAQLRRAADREYRVLYHLRECPGVLQVTGYDDAAPLGPTVLFDDFTGAVPLDVFLRANEDLDFADRVLLIEQIARTLAACHDREVTHGALSPAAVLVRNWGKFETRLFNFQLSSAQQVESTIHWSALADDPWVLYQAPELRQSPTKRGPQSDIFSLGALAFLILTGKPPGKDLQDIEATLHRDGALDPRRVSDDIPKEAADAIVFATETKTISRADSVAGWLYIFLDAVTSPPQQEAFADPLLARKGDMLSRDLRVAGELGSGATSRVLAVERDGRKYALKVSLDSEQDARLKAEAEVLRKLAQAPVATLQDELELQGRTCLLLTLAGSTTLQRFLAAEGSASADLAARYGKDLLDALEELEALGITHRDIKPANIGVGSLGHGRKRLILFDFSLAGSSATSVGIGTAVYKDPYLAERGAWDAAADRWSAAVTLHELLTGIRPHYETPKYVDDHGHEVPADLDAAPTDKHATLKLAAERFDSQLRDALTAFFNTAFAPAIEQRFTDAAQMRRRWEACFDLEAQIHSQPHAAEEPTPSQPAANKLTPNEQLSDNEIAKISTDAAIASLPLTGRAKNALDRMGLLTGRDLLTLPENRLSVARGVGRMVAKEIVEFVNRWRALRPMSAAAGPVYFPSYRGEDILLTHSELSGRAVQALSDAGLRSLAQVADAPKSQVEVLLQKAMVEPSKLEELLTKAHRAKQDQFNSVEGVLSAFIPKQKKRAESLELLFGLRDPFIGRLDMTISQVARHRGSTRPNEYIQLSKCREQWEAIEALGNEPRPLDLLKSLVRALVVQAGGAIRADRFAERVLAELPHDRRADPQLTRAKAAAWARIVCEAEGQEEAGMRWVRLRSGRSPNNAANLPWVCQSDLLAEQVTALGKLADELAERPILASSTEAQRLATALVQGSSLERLPPDRLLALATDASQTAALSARLEIYPRGMDAARALELTAASLPVQLGAGAVQAHVRARYPEASPLPDAPTLDALMTPYGYKVFGSIYQRPQAEHQTASTQNTANSFHTQLDEVPDVFDSGDAANVDAEGTELDAPPTQASTATKTRKAGTSSPTLRAVRPEDARREAFVERLRQTLERDAYRVLGVHITRAAEATLALSRYLGVKPVLLDQLLVERMVQKKVPLHVIQGADREGPSGAAWPNLLRLAEAAAKELAAELLPNKQPLLLAQPGLLARYQLKDFLLRVAEASKQDDARAILLLVPRRDQGGMPVINNQLAIPGVLPTHTFWVSREWLDHQAADAAE